MKRSIKRQWLKDLRSGEYEQSRRALRADNGYCCLGVLVHNAARQTINETGCKVIENEKHPMTHDYVDLGIAHSNLHYVTRYDIPDELLPVVGLTEKQQSKLVEMNDATGEVNAPKTFKQIADWISRNIPAEDD